MILDGIFNANRYSPMLARVGSMTNDARFYAFDLSLDDTVHRHQARSQAVEFTAKDMAAWYHGWQPLSFVRERRIGPSETVSAIVNRVLEDR